MIVHDSQSSQHCDLVLADQLGVDTLQLMELAGKAVVDEIQQDIIGNGVPRACIFCGPGNNGGDGLVVARLLLFKGWNVALFLLSGSDKYHGPSLKNFLSIQHLSQRYSDSFKLFASPESYEPASELSNFSPDLIVDAMFGVGLRYPLNDFYSSVIDAINNSNIPCYSIDISTGVHADTGAILSTAIKARKTVTFSAAKPGHLIYPGREYTGNLIIRDIGVPTDLAIEHAKYNTIMSLSELKTRLPLRFSDSHKGSYGTVVIIGGSIKYRGALALAVESAYRSGAGKVYACYRSSQLNYFTNLPYESIHVPLDDSQEEYFLDRAMKCVQDLVTSNQAVICCGPGLGRDDMMQNLVKKLYLEFNGNMLLDADALYAIKDIIHEFPHQCHLILTPHLGEMSYLTGIDLKRIKEDLPSIAKNYAEKLKCTLVLKSANTIVAYPGSLPFIQYFGNSGMATAGTGDVLAGVISAIFAQKVAAFDAAILGTCLHGLAGDFAVKKTSSWSLTANDLCKYLHLAFKKVSDA